jgi:hypothetical protein
VVVYAHPHPAAFRSHEQRGFWNTPASHLLQTERLGYQLDYGRLQAASAPPVLVLHRTQGTISVFLDRIGDPKNAQPIGRHLNAVMNRDTAPMIGRAGVDARVADLTSDGQVIVQPHSIQDELCLPRAVREVLQKRET